MAYKRKRKSNLHKRKISPPPAETFSEDQREAYFADVVETFDLGKFESISWKIRTSSFSNGLRIEEAPVKFVSDNEVAFVNPDRTPLVRIGQLMLTGKATGLRKILDSNNVIETTLYWSFEGELREFSLCVRVSLPDRVVVLSAPFSVSPDPCQDTVADLCTMCKRSTVQLTIQKHQLETEEHDSCLQLTISVFATHKVFAVGGAEYLPIHNTHRLKETVVKLFHSSVASMDALNLHPEVMIDEETIKTQGIIAWTALRFLI